MISAKAPPISAPHGNSNERLFAAPQGFREYDVRWRYPEEIGLEGLQSLGLAFGTWLREVETPHQVVVGRDWRSYSLEVKNAFVEGLVLAGCEVLDIGLALSPVVYFSQVQFGNIPGAMITASHNPNGWTGAKLSAVPPLTAGPEDIARIRELTLNRQGIEHEGGKHLDRPGTTDAYVDELTRGIRISRPLKVVCATGNGTAGAFAPQVLSKIGCEVAPRHNELDHSFPNYNPNPESPVMLQDMSRAVQTCGADIALGFDGDGDRCGAVDECGTPVQSDKLGLLLARSLAPKHPGAKFLADVKSTSLFAMDATLRRHGCDTEYVPTGHSYMKRELHAQAALAGFERSGHFFFAPPIGRGYDDALKAAVEICLLLDSSGLPLSALVRQLPETWSTPTLEPSCADSDKYGAIDQIRTELNRLRLKGELLGGCKIQDILSVNGARVSLSGGAWALVRASSNTPNLVVIVESPNSDDEAANILNAVAGVLKKYPSVDSSCFDEP